MIVFPAYTMYACTHTSTRILYAFYVNATVYEMLACCMLLLQTDVGILHNQTRLSLRFDLQIRNENRYDFAIVVD